MKKKENILRPKRQMILFNLMINLPLLVFGFFCLLHPTPFTPPNPPPRAKAVIIADDESVAARCDNGRVSRLAGNESNLTFNVLKHLSDNHTGCAGGPLSCSPSS